MMYKIYFSRWYKVTLKAQIIHQILRMIFQENILLTDQISCPAFDVINFEINHRFFISSFSYEKIELSSI